MISASNKPALQSGFTLIELMVVMTIITLLIGLGGPLAINSLDKAQAKSEILTLKNRLRKISYRAYILQSSAEVTFKGKEITISYNGSNSQPITITNEVLFFNEQVLYFNNYGFVQPLKLNLTYRDINTTLDLASLINTSVVPDEQ